MDGQRRQWGFRGVMSVVCASLLFGCNSAEVTQPTTETGDVHDEHAFLNLGTRAEIEQQIAAGDVEMRPGFEFRGVMLHITSFERFNLEISYERPDGTRSDFFGVEPDEPEYPFANATAILPEPAVAIWIRVVEGQQSIEFLASRFFHEVPEGGVLDIHMDDYDPAYEVDDGLAEATTESGFLTLSQGLAGRYIPSDAALSGGRNSTHRYEGAPNWSPSACGGSFRPGTRDLAEYLVREFNATHYGGYSCRQNTANASKMSVHGTGRAFDLHYNRVGGDADNNLGDPTANWLIANAAQTGVQLVIWDRTSWSVSRKTHRQYGGPHPHDDHLHIEVTSAAAQRNAPFYGDPSVATDPAPGSSSNSGGGSGLSSGGQSMLGGNLGSEGVTCMSSTLGRRVAAGTCVQMSYQKYGGRCNWAQCSSSGYWVRAGSSCSGVAEANSVCGGQNPLAGSGDSGSGTGGGSTSRSCNSQTLGREVPDGTCVQVNYESSSCSRCGWFTCSDGAWMCTSESSCSAGSKNAHAECGSTEPDPEDKEVDGEEIGRGRLTYYYIAYEGDYSGSKTVSVKDCSGTELTKVSQAFYDALKLEGTGKLEDERVLNVGSSNSCFEVLSDEFKWGKGNRNNALEPMRSVAMQQNLYVSFGETLYVSELDGVVIPSIDGIEGFTHDGCVRVDDVGGAITDFDMDFFAGTKKAFEAVDALLPSNTRVLMYGQANSKCAYLKR